MNQDAEVTAELGTVEVDGMVNGKDIHAQLADDVLGMQLEGKFDDLRIGDNLPPAASRKLAFSLLLGLPMATIGRVWTVLKILLFLIVAVIVGIALLAVAIIKALFDTFIRTPVYIVAGMLGHLTFNFPVMIVRKIAQLPSYKVYRENGGDMKPAELASKLSTSAIAVIIARLLR